MFDKLLGSLPEKMVKEQLSKSIYKILKETESDFLVICMKDENVEFCSGKGKMILELSEYNRLVETAKRYYSSSQTPLSK